MPIGGLSYEAAAVQRCPPTNGGGAWRSFRSARRCLLFFLRDGNCASRTCVLDAANGSKVLHSGSSPVGRQRSGQGRNCFEARSGVLGTVDWQNSQIRSFESLSLGIRQIPRRWARRKQATACRRRRPGARAGAGQRHLCRTLRARDRRGVQPSNHHAPLPTGQRRAVRGAGALHLVALELPERLFGGHS